MNAASKEGETAHTPGPWRENGCIIEGPKMGLQVAQVQYRAAGSNIGFASQTKHEAFSNARLIAAAPDLIEAAMAALNYIENTESELGIKLSSGDKLRAAIEKARAKSAPEKEG